MNLGDDLAAPDAAEALGWPARNDPEHDATRVRSDRRQASGGADATPMERLAFGSPELARLRAELMNALLPEPPSALANRSLDAWERHSANPSSYQAYEQWATPRGVVLLVAQVVANKVIRAWIMSELTDRPETLRPWLISDEAAMDSLEREIAAAAVRSAEEEVPGVRPGRFDYYGARDDGR